MYALIDCQCIGEHQTYIFACVPWIARPLFVYVESENIRKISLQCFRERQTNIFYSASENASSIFFYSASENVRNLFLAAEPFQMTIQIIAGNRG